MRIKGLTIIFFDSKIYGNTNITTPLKFQDGYWNQPMEKEIPALETIIFMLSCETLGAIKIEIGTKSLQPKSPLVAATREKTQPYLVFRKRWWPVFPPVGHRLLDEKRWNLSKNKDTSRLRPDSRDFFRRKNTSESELHKQINMFIHLHFYSIPVKGPCKRWEG